MHPDRNERSSSDDKKEVIYAEFLANLSGFIRDYEKVDDPFIKAKIKQLQELKGELETPQKKSGRDWLAIGKTVLSAMHWMKVIYDFFQS